MLDTVLFFIDETALPADFQLLGLTLQDRLMLAAKRAGFKKFILLSRGQKLQDVPEAFLALSPKMLFSLQAWKDLKQFEPVPESIHFSPVPEAAAVVRTAHKNIVLEAAGAASSCAEFLQKVSSKLRSEPLYLGERAAVPVNFPDQVSAARRWLLQSLVKDTEGFMSKHFERKISLFVTRFLVMTPITPNAMTILSSGIGAFGALFFISPEKWYHVAGALLFWLHSILDGCDGEIARLKFLESRWGGLLDFWGDNVVHCAVFSCIAVGLYRFSGAEYAALLGVLAVTGTLVSAGLVYWQTLRPKKEGGPLFTSVAASNSVKTVGAAERIADFLARRDFIYLVIVLAAVGRIEWFLWMSAAGSPLYALALIGFHARAAFQTARA